MEKLCTVMEGELYRVQQQIFGENQINVHVLQIDFWDS